MELNKKTYNKLVSFIKDTKDIKKNGNYELEARIMNKNIVQEESYTRLFQKLTFSKEYNGLGYKYDMKNILDVILDKRVSEHDFDSLRMSIIGENEIKKYWLHSSIEGLNPIYIEKEKIDKMDDENYNIRFSLNNELPENELLEKNINLLNDNSYEKIYRMKNRYSIKTDDNLFLIEMSKTKMGTGKTFKESNTMKEKIMCEIEIEFIGKESKLNDEEIANKFLSHVFIILKILENNNIIISNSLKNILKNGYKKLIDKKTDDFIAASPVTMHRENLFRSDITPNIYNRYAVTLKADGERNFAYVVESDNKNINGKIYIFNSGFHFLDTGYRDEKWVNTLIEGEYIPDTNEIFFYDILFCKGEDVRRRHLINVMKENKDTRLELLDKFMYSKTREIDKKFSEELCIKLNNKKYIQSVRNDGTDIFDKIREIWDSRKFTSFNVDGIIFVPKFDYYPMDGRSWPKLFKWKPPRLNSIDFLIRSIKDEQNKDVRSPYLKLIPRPDGKEEYELKQYVSFQLFVTGTKKVYSNKENNRIRIPVPFNPFGLDNKNSAQFNIAKLIIEDDGKIYANDPITNERVEIFDDIIVEFGYDETQPEEFRWIPYRFRRDKTFLYRNGEKNFGNGERVANDIFRSLQLPITEEMITTGEIPVLPEDKEGLMQAPYYIRQMNDNGKSKRFPYQNFHNLYVKYQLLYFSSPCYINEITTGFKGKILDLCCGRGVDYSKIKNARYAEIVGMDIDFQNIKDAQEWFRAMANPPPKAYYVRGNSSKLIWPDQACSFNEADKMNTLKFIPTKYMFDTISLQFCFHYFFENEITFRTILQNLNDNLKFGGFVIGTTFDGERIFNALKNSSSIMGKEFSGDLLWKIDKKYTNKTMNFTEKTPNFGKQIDVLIKTIGVVHPEYLVNFKYFTKMMEQYGFSLVFIKPFEELYNELIEGKNLMNQSQKDIERSQEYAKSMSDAEKQLSFFFSAFMFKKEKNSSDQLLQKLVDLMAKKDKVEKAVYKVNEVTEETIQDVR